MFQRGVHRSPPQVGQGRAGGTPHRAGTPPGGLSTPAHSVSRPRRGVTKLPDNPQPAPLFCWKRVTDMSLNILAGA
ncbi:hypothetical protein [Deinococcus hopiensis]|uniref:Uncharacterized protein n=1 Tax=Deinococcus hopiensis KR-140 TaxID=695939 RepID=A0A1W1UAY6_9DEIO|nr:hypothetical protein [Deinococcus hopiensis]SMB78223.1 hypothetical protein SAMN00790413_06559 [Deinococcus hopiensis KR-140]